MKFEQSIKEIWKFCLKELLGFRKERVRIKETTFSIRLTVSAITERQQLPDALRAKTVASRLDVSTRPSTEVQGNEECLAYKQKATHLETMSPSWIGLR